MFNELIDSKELHIVQYEYFLQKRYKKQHAEFRIGCISKKSFSFQPFTKPDTETTGENPAVWYTGQAETLTNQLFSRLILHSVFMSSF